MRALVAFSLMTTLGLAGCSSDSDTGTTDAAPGQADAAAADASVTATRFESFRIDSGGGPCPDNVDCTGFVELDADGTLRLDRDGELPVVVHEAQVTAGERDQAIDVLTDPALVALLDMESLSCNPPSDVFETMSLTAGGHEHQVQTIGCDQPPIDAARSALSQLAQSYFP